MSFNPDENAKAKDLHFVWDPSHRETLSGRVRHACKMCQLAKIKCSGQIPCETCALRGVSCPGLVERKRTRKSPVVEEWSLTADPAPSDLPPVGSVQHEHGASSRPTWTACFDEHLHNNQSIERSISREYWRSDIINAAPSTCQHDIRSQIWSNAESRSSFESANDWMPIADANHSWSTAAMSESAPPGASMSLGENGSFHDACPLSISNTRVTPQGSWLGTSSTDRYALPGDDLRSEETRADEQIATKLLFAARALEEQAQALRQIVSLQRNEGPVLTSNKTSRGAIEACPRLQGDAVGHLEPTRVIAPLPSIPAGDASLSKHWSVVPGDNRTRRHSNHRSPLPSPDRSFLMEQSMHTPQLREPQEHLADLTSWENDLGWFCGTSGWLISLM